MTIIEERLARLDGLVLKSGGHTAPDNGLVDACVMEAVSYIAGEPWSDHPACTSKVITSFLVNWNDALDDEGRQKLKPYIPRVVGTAGTKKQERTRGLMAVDWFIHHHLPAWLQLAGLNDVADETRALPKLDSWKAVTAAQPTLARSAARSAAWAAAESAALSAAESAATEVLTPTALSLQESAFELLDRMIAVTAEAA
jgi:hypothetical protein